MEQQIVKTGNGFLWGVSTESDQPGKTLTLFDGSTILCQIKLDTAFPARTITLEDGTAALVEPGLSLNLVFVTGLRIQNDGQVSIHWR